MSDNPFDDETTFDPKRTEHVRPATEPRHVLQGGWVEPATEAAADNAQVHVHVSAVSANDAELDAMQLCLAALDGLDTTTKVRVLNWLSSRSGSHQMAYPYPMAVQPPRQNPGF